MAMKLDYEDLFTDYKGLVDILKNLKVTTILTDDDTGDITIFNKKNDCIVISNIPEETKK